MRDWVLLIHSASLLIITVTLCFALRQLLSLWKQMRNEFWVLFNLTDSIKGSEAEDARAGSRSKSTSIDGKCS